jgi:RHS repeat-associated protein
VTDEDGNVVSKHKYLPFGREFSNAGADEVNTHKFTGHERDKGTGLDYMLARYYGNNLPRFLSPDPIPGTLQVPQSWNRYTYSLNNPIRYIDPFGEEYVDSTGQKLKDETLEKGNDDEKDTVTELEEEEEEVSTEISDQVVLVVVDAEGTPVEGTEASFENTDENYSSEYAKGQEQVKALDPDGSKGYQLRVKNGEYKPTAIDSDGTITKSTITIFKGSISRDSTLNKMDRQEAVRRVFAHESHHGLGRAHRPGHGHFPPGIYGGQ